MLSHARLRANQLPDGPEPRARDASYARQDPRAHNARIYGYDAEQALGGPAPEPGGAPG